MTASSNDFPAGHRRERARPGGQRRQVAGRRAHGGLDARERQALVEQQHLQALAHEGGGLGDDGRAARVVQTVDALQLELVDGGREQPGEREAQAELERDAHDAHGRAPQPVGVARAGGLLAGDPGAGDVVELVGDGEQGAGDGGRQRRRRGERPVVLADGAGHRVAEAAGLGVDARP